jgi:LPXTG-motif cell wall anchor domain protein|nr:LPXTG cell wall anchor domain-containing protein [uncultured Peptostreptococcus sp.]
MKEMKRKVNGCKTSHHSIKKHQLGVVGVAVTAMVFFANSEVNIHALETGETATVIASETNNTANISNNGTRLVSSDRGSAESTRASQTSNINNTNSASNSSNKVAEGSSESPAISTETKEASGLAGSSETTAVSGQANDSLESASPTRSRRVARSTPASTPASTPTSASASTTASTPTANYNGSVSLIGQWTNESRVKNDTVSNYTTGTDKLGSPLANPGLFRGIAKTFLGWSDKPPVDGKIAEGARLFSPEDTVATAFPNGIGGDSKLYGVYSSLNDQDTPLPDSTFGMGLSLLSGMNKFAIEDNKVKIDAGVKADDVLPNTNLKEETITGNTRKILDVYKPENNDTTKVNEVVLTSEFEMDKTTAMLVYRNPNVGYVGPVLSNTYKGNQFSLDKNDKTYTYVDLNVNLDKDMVVPDKFFAEFNGYSWRPVYALGVNGENKEALNVFSPSDVALGNTKDSFNSLVSNTDPKVTFGIETKGYNNITIRMILRSSGVQDSDRRVNERIAESDVVADEGKSIAETITRNMTLRSLTSADLKKLFPGKSDEDINKMVLRISQDKAKELADTNGQTVLTVKGSVEGNVSANAGRISFLTLSSALPIKKVESNVLELGYVKPAPQPNPQPSPQPDVKPNPQPDVKPDPQPDVKPDPQPDVKPDPQPQPRTQVEKKKVDYDYSKRLAKTGTSKNDSLLAIGGLSILGGIGLLSKRRKEQD